MELKYEATGAERKSLVAALCEILGAEETYLGAPSFAYEVAGYVVDKNGTLTCPENATQEDADHLVSALGERGIKPLSQEDDAATIDEATDRIVIEVPKDGFTEAAMENLEKLIASKATLLKKVLETDCLIVEQGVDTLRFPWFTRKGLDGEAKAYAQLVHALCYMAKEQKRVVATDKPSDNEKFTFRVFLIRLGFIGPEYKNARKLLMANLSGNSAFRSGEPPKKPVVDGHPSDG